MNRPKILTLLLLFISISSFSQSKKWSLQECVDYAIKNNITLKQSELDIENTQIGKKDALGNFLPTINANASHSWNIGLNQNITTGLLQNQTTQFSSVGLNSNITIYNGLQNLNKARRANIAILGSQLQLAKLKDDILLNIANAYLQILFNKEFVKVQTEQVANAERQYTKIDETVKAGLLPRGNLLDSKATVASAKQQLIDAQNNLFLSKISLAQLLQLDEYQNFDVDDAGFQAPAADGSGVQILVSETSDRLQLLAPFDAWDGKNISGAKLLIKAFGKCTTDHISMAGPWLRFRGHLDNISNNMLIGAVNAYNQEANKVKNQLTGEYAAVPAVARAYKAAGVPSIVVGDQNYGEGSSREHAAMEPRFLGVKAVLVKSFARIHETNLKKQGMLALTFANEADYDKIKEDDTINFLDLTEFAPGKPLTLEFVHTDGSKDIILANHTYNDSQIGWFKAGSALNLIAAGLA